jgi:phospholipid/cholesterol/gamma-HCH transport system permease protein
LKDEPADFEVAEDGASVRLTGDWTVSHLGDAPQRLAAEVGDATVLDLHEIGRIDTAGAYGLIKATPKLSLDNVRARPETTKLVSLIAEAVAREKPSEPKRWSINEMMERLGRGVFGVTGEFFDTMAFNGKLMVVTGKTILHPSRIRLASLVSIAERAGLDALPIITVTNFFVGAVIAFIAVTTLADFGAQVFAVEGVGIGILREFDIVITAVLLAGRSSSSFAAEIGAMKMQQEIDAMQVMGVDPFEALVLPRFLALLILTPLLTVVAAIAGLAGGCVALWAVAGLGPEFFFQRIADNVGIHQFWIGLSKAPVMAIVVAAIGCRQGMEVGGDVESLGRRVTAAVVHAIFSIIMIDAVFAMVFTELDL